VDIFVTVYSRGERERERERERESAFQKTSFSAVTESVLDLVECPIQNIVLRSTF
jgi:hypothetical protein